MRRMCRAAALVSCDMTMPQATSLMAHPCPPIFTLSGPAFTPPMRSPSYAAPPRVTSAGSCPSSMSTPSISTPTTSLRCVPRCARAWGGGARAADAVAGDPLSGPGAAAGAQRRSTGQWWRPGRRMSVRDSASQGRDAVSCRWSGGGREGVREEGRRKEADISRGGAFSESPCGTDSKNSTSPFFGNLVFR